MAAIRNNGSKNAQGIIPARFLSHPVLRRRFHCKVKQTAEAVCFRRRYFYYGV
jgi:hypothetical protein